MYTIDKYYDLRNRPHRAGLEDGQKINREIKTYNSNDCGSSLFRCFKRETSEYVKNITFYILFFLLRNVMKRYLLGGERLYRFEWECRFKIKANTRERKPVELGKNIIKKKSVCY